MAQSSTIHRAFRLSTEWRRKQTTLEISHGIIHLRRRLNIRAKPHEGWLAASQNSEMSIAWNETWDRLPSWPQTFLFLLGKFPYKIKEWNCIELNSWERLNSNFKSIRGAFILLVRIINTHHRHGFDDEITSQERIIYRNDIREKKTRRRTGSSLTSSVS